MPADPLKSSAELCNGRLALAFPDKDFAQIVLGVGEPRSDLKRAAVNPDGGVKGVVVH